ncbi:hypothetical protein CDAR_527861 [Caerostris darwini]|uniref:Uncharacterized protein n=1 Tax=Caerostris darwini TaxID=1538125 RepID=A0AAV4MCK3_9ARAC|nr:hypothetical protein CDAR_527861 [Caerostris darwini]
MIAELMEQWKCIRMRFELTRFPGADPPISVQERFRNRREISTFSLSKSPKKRMRKWGFSVHSVCVLIQGILSRSAAVRTAMPSDFYQPNISASSFQDTCVLRVEGFQQWMQNLNLLRSF